MDETPPRPHASRQRVRRGVLGILSRGSALLVIRRAERVAKAGYWCFPGGHIELGETSRRAIQRELAEELGIVAKATVRVGSIRVTDPDYVLAVWRVRHSQNELLLSKDEVAEALWLTPAQIRRLKPSLPSNERVLEMLGTRSCNGAANETLTNE